MKLQDHISQVERYGFVRRHFPLSYNGHTIQILKNDGFIDDGRLMFDFSLHCKNCDMINHMSGRFPANCERQTEYVVNAKIAIFEKFNSIECQQKQQNP